VYWLKLEGIKELGAREDHLSREVGDKCAVDAPSVPSVLRKTFSKHILTRER